MSLNRERFLWEIKSTEVGSWLLFGWCWGAVAMAFSTVSSSELSETFKLLHWFFINKLFDGSIWPLQKMHIPSCCSILICVQNICCLSLLDAMLCDQTCISRNNYFILFVHLLINSTSSLWYCRISHPGGPTKLSTQTASTATSLCIAWEISVTVQNSHFLQ